MYRYSNWCTPSRWKDIDDILIVLRDGRSLVLSIDEGKSNVVLTPVDSTRKITTSRKKFLVRDYKGREFLSKGKLSSIAGISGVLGCITTNEPLGCQLKNNIG